MKKNLKTIGFAALMALTTFHSPLTLAEESRTVCVSSAFYVYQGQVQTVYLDREHHVRKLFVSARGGSYQDATMEVIVNGDVKGTIHVPGYDPSYVVTVDAETQSIQFRQISGGSIYVSEVDAVETDREGHERHERGEGGQAGTQVGDSEDSDSAYDYQGTTDLKVTTGATEIAARAIELVNALTAESNYNELGQYLLPIKKTAAQLYANGRSHSMASDKVREKLQALSQQIEAAADYLENNLEKSNDFNLATELMTLDEQIKSLIGN